jgi:hypothetical protein
MHHAASSETCPASSIVSLAADGVVRRAGAVPANRDGGVRTASRRDGGDRLGTILGDQLLAP